jgi:ATP-binding cassette, subfamily B, bacterial AbcA/BmrA
MKESFEFASIKPRLEADVEGSKIKAAKTELTDEAARFGVVRQRTSETFERLNDTDKVIPAERTEIHENLLLLRSAIQDKLERANPEETNEEETRAKLLAELVSPELMRRYKKIFAEFKLRGEVTVSHPEREWIDPENEKMSQEIEGWISELIGEIRTKSQDFKESDEAEIRADAWMLFQAVGNVLNTRNIERDIREEKAKAAENSNEALTPDELNKSIAKKLSGRYPMAEDEIEILASVVNKEEEQYNFRILMEAIRHVWNEYSPYINKKDLAVLSLGHMTTMLMEGYTPSLWSKMFPEGGFNLAVFLEFMGIDKAADIINSRLEILESRMGNDVKKKINERISNTLFYQEFEFMQEKSQGDIFETLDDGRDATLDLLRESVTRFAPTAGSIFAALGFLTSINPILGGISLAGLPAMYYLARKRKDQFWQIHQKSLQERGKYMSKLSAVKEGFEQIRTSSEVPTIAEDFTRTTNTIDALHLKENTMLSRYRILDAIPRDVTSIAAAASAWVLWRQSLIPGGAVISNIQYAERLRNPVEGLVNTYFKQLPETVQRIKRMEKMFGDYDKLETPSSDKEKNRLSVSELPNFDIAVRNLEFKGILRNVNMNISQGEFVVLGGPSGSGKTTLLRNMIGLFKPQGGEVTFGGSKISDIKKYGDESLYAALAYSNQQPLLFPHLTLRENLLLWTKNDPGSNEIERLMQNLNLEKFIGQLDEKVNYMSGGERVRFGVARALLKKPKILMLDEPTSSLDSASAEEVRSLLRKIHAENPAMTIICVSHDEQLKKAAGRSMELPDMQRPKDKT